MDFTQHTITDLFFDLDHTLYDFEKNSELAFHEIFQKLELKGVEDFMIHFKPINDYYWDLLSRNEITHDELRISRLKDTFEKINVVVTEDQIRCIADEFIANLTRFTHVFEGTHESLEYLQSKYRLHIITNGPDHVQVTKLKNTGLEKYFETVTNSEISGVKKPNAGIFTYALNLARVKPENSVMIGDNLTADVHGALNVGMHVIWFNEANQKTEVNGFKEIRHLLELKEIL
jgi:YjjG family noncanonical pyrimidine nucleotidase